MRVRLINDIVNIICNMKRRYDVEQLNISYRYKFHLNGYGTLSYITSYPVNYRRYNKNYDEWDYTTIYNFVTVKNKGKLPMNY